MKANPLPGGKSPQSAANARLLMTIPEAAQVLAIGTTLAYELVGRGVLPHVRLGRAIRVPRGALEAWIAANTRAATGRTENRTRVDD